MLNDSSTYNNETLKHAYISAILKAVVLFSLPFLAIVVYFNAIAEWRPIPLVVLSSVLALFYLIYRLRQRFGANQLALTVGFLLLLAANINCYANVSVSHAGVTSLLCTFAISVVASRWAQGSMLVLTQVSLYCSYGLATGFSFEIGDIRWLLVIFFGQMIILSGMHLLFSRVAELFQEEQQLRLDSEAASREKSRFLANMSHEIRTPIAGVIGLLRLIKGANLTSEQQQKLLLARQSSQLLSSIVDDILDYSKIEAGKLAITLKDFSIDQLLDQVCSIIEPKLPEHDNQLIVHKDWNQEIWVEGDLIRLQQVLLNLLSNANKFTQHGEIELSASLYDESDKFTFECAVKDSGIGMSHEQVDSLFKAFHQLDNTSAKTAQGTGLGLVISKQILTLMGGTIRVESEPGKGSTFYISIKLGKASPPSLQMAEDNETQDLSGLSVLVVEDNFINQTILKEMLASAEVKIEMADNGEAALNRLTDLPQDSIDIILMDCQMPTLDGYQTTQCIRQGKAGEAWTTIPIIALTANALEGDREKCLAAGMDDYLSKPVDRELLLTMLSKYFRAEADTSNQPK